MHCRNTGRGQGAVYCPSSLHMSCCMRYMMLHAACCMLLHLMSTALITPAGAGGHACSALASSRSATELPEGRRLG